MRRAHRRWPAALLLAAAVVALLVTFWDWNWFKGPIQQRVSQKTGREFVIAGDLNVDLGLVPTIRFDDVRFSNPSWARDRQMLTTERAEFTVDLWQLIRGRLVLPSVRFVAPTVDLETAPGGANNWTLARQPSEIKSPDRKDEDEKGLPVIGLLSVDRGVLVYFDPPSSTDVKVEVETTRDAAGRDGIRLHATGRYRREELTVDATGGPVLSLQNAEVPYPVAARFRVGRTRGSIDGQVTGIARFAGADLQVSLEGDTLADLYPLAGLALPGTPPYRVRGELVREGDRYRFHGFQGQVGDSDLSGDVDVHVDDRIALVARLESRQLDLDDLAGFIGATPQTGAGETAAPEQKAEAERKEDEDPRLLPDKPIDLSKLRSMDADVRFAGKSIRDKRMPVENLDAHLVLKDGVLKVDPLNFGVAGGDIVSRIDLDARKDRLVVGADLQFRKLDLRKLMPGNEMVASGAGLLGGRIRLAGEGRSLSELLASANGDAGFAMRGGQVSHLLLEAIGLDAAEAFERLLRGDHEARLRCAVADLSVESGLARTRSFVVDTSDTNIGVDGQVNFKDEKLDLVIRPLPKDWSPLALRSPLHVGGTLKDPEFGVDKKLVAKGGAAALLGALVNPLAALLPLIETGPGKDADCGDLIAAVERNAQTKAP